MKGWLKLATSGAVVRRAVGYAVIVGTVLAAINHGPALLNGEFDRFRGLQIVLTMLVPYTVSTLSSCQAIRQLDSSPRQQSQSTP